MDIQFTNEMHRKHRALTMASSSTILPIVIETGAVDSVVDLGCGLGIWLHAVKTLGASRVLGIDGDYLDSSQMFIDPHEFRKMDFRHPEPVDGHFDLALSLEVIEHLEEKYSRCYLDLLTSLSDRILFSAAIPGQPGDAHVNARWPGYWIEEFKKRGYTALDFVRPRIWHNESVALCYRQNMLFFIKESVREGDALFRHLPRANCLHLVDEGTLEVLLKGPATLRRCVQRMKTNLNRVMFSRKSDV